MKKSLLDKECSEALVARSQQLTSGTQPLWGTMTATEMLLHCNRVNDQLLTTEPLKKGTKPKQYIARWLVLYLLPHLPKNRQTPKRNITKGQVTTTDFAVQQQQFTDTIRRFPLHQKPIKLPHPYFGDLDTAQWGLAGYKHIDHHLRQFGV